MKKPERTGKIVKTFFFLLLLIIFLGAAVYAGWKRLQVSVKINPPQQVIVQKKTFIHEILERGSVDSASNIEIRCQVESAGGLTIISVVPEGAIVKKGDLLVELDSSTLRENVTKQRIAVLASKSKLAQSEADLKTADLTLQEYLKGKFEEEKKTIENEIFAAEESVRTQEDNLAFYKRLLERGYVTDSKVAADIIELDKAINAKDIAKLKLEVLNTYTKEKNVVQYKAAIASNQAKVESDKQSLQLDEERLEHLENQLKLCRIVAPQDGQVVYYMPRWGGDEDLIKEGKKVFERQILLRLPDPTQMQVKGLVNEANIRLVKVGQTASIRLEAFPNQVFGGIVRVVNDYPEPGNWMGGSMSKEYMTTISILDSPEGIKPGLTAEARITVNEIHNALVLPIQAVFEYGGKIYVIIFRNGKWDKIEIKTGATNDKEVVILEGLKEDDIVVLGAWAHRDKIDLPQLTPDQEKNDQEKKEEKMENLDPNNPKTGENRPPNENREQGGGARGGERSGEQRQRRERPTERTEQKPEEQKSKEQQPENNKPPEIPKTQEKKPEP
ncbi:MAG: efflux RND transporter periplasmic adaptor subunit [Planctomycetaceae bacterium]|jgi:multidrug efflux pump subunit AcrA (membrane-fusion protein)|nr:efflux RND transporter periplasmic adaptor subunit [Planctomycetaceae bacterium]